MRFFPYSEGEVNLGLIRPPQSLLTQEEIKMASKGINFNVAKLTVNDSFRLAFCNLQIAEIKRKRYCCAHKDGIPVTVNFATIITNSERGKVKIEYHLWAKGEKNGQNPQGRNDLKVFQGNTHRVCRPPKTAKTSRNCPLGLTFIKLLAGNNVRFFPYSEGEVNLGLIRPPQSLLTQEEIKMASKGINFNVAKLTVNNSFRLAFCNLQIAEIKRERYYCAHKDGIPVTVNFATIIPNSERDKVKIASSPKSVGYRYSQY